MQRTFQNGRIGLILCATVALAAACGNTAGGAATVTSGAADTATAADAGQGGVTDAGGAAGQDTAAATPGTECKADKDCTSGVCLNGDCGKSCAASVDCEAGFNCSLDAKNRMVCHKPAYADGIGALCGHDGKCADTLKCVGRAYSAQAFCTAQCAADVDCPSNFQCADVPNSGKICIKREFCGECQYDAQCGADRFCTKMTGGNYCTRSCQPGGTDCPRYSACQDVGGKAGYQCVHSAGTCVGEGKQCEPCNTLISGQCGDGSCLQYNHTKETFCAMPCTSSCASGYDCVQVTAAGGKACVPADKKSPKCVNKINNLYEVGAKIDEFAMVGMVDTDGNGDMYDEAPRIIRFADYDEHYSLLLVNVTAVWCTYCQQETKEMTKLLYNYGDSDVFFFQVLFDGAKPGEIMTMPLLKQWQKQLKPAGAVGMDPNRISVPWNTQGGTPLNMLVNAKTGEVLWKQNGYNKAALISAINKYLKVIK